MTPHPEHHASAPDPRRRKLLGAGLLAAAGGVATLAGLRPSNALAAPAGSEARYALADANHLVSGPNVEWVRNAIRVLWAERKAAGITPIVRLPVPFDPGLVLYLKDESRAPTGSLKHRVAWALLMHALVEGRIGPQTRLFEASSGNTAIGEAYFARLLGLSFTAVMRPGISPGKIAAIKGFGGQAEVLADGVAPGRFIGDALQRDPAAYNLDQFANTERALDYFDADPAASMNMAGEVFRQIDTLDHPCPTWFVAGAGSGGTATSIGRYLRKWADYGRRGCPAQLAVVDPEDSALFEWYKTGNPTISVDRGSRIEGIGTRGPVRFGVTFSLLRESVARMMRVPDPASVAGMHLATRLVGREVGPSTGTNLYGAFRLLDEMHRQRRAGSVVAIVCDDGGRYRDNYYNADWIRANGLEYADELRQLESFWQSGRWS